MPLLFQVELAVTCNTCLNTAYFKGTSNADATVYADRAGWKFRHDRVTDEVVCPMCDRKTKPGRLHKDK